MVHSFDLRDIPLLTRLENSGTSLCSELALTHGGQPLRSALAGYFSLRKRRAHTCVASGEPDGEGFAQMRPHGERGLMTYIAPALSAGHVTTTWCALLDAMAMAAGGLGLQQLIAEVAGDGAELDVLRQAGFAVYLRQDILRLAQRAPGAEPHAVPLRAATPADTWAIQQLYYNTAPRLAQVAEVVPPGKPAGTACGYVLDAPGAGSELAAYLEVRRGPLGAWFNVMIHPQAEMQAQQVLAQGLALLGEPWRRPVYGCVRRYQEWLWEPLLALGFEPFMSSAVLVKRLVVPVAEHETPLVHVLEAHAKATSPVTRAATSDEGLP